MPRYATPRRFRPADELTHPNPSLSQAVKIAKERLAEREEEKARASQLADEVKALKARLAEAESRAARPAKAAAASAGGKEDSALRQERDMLFGILRCSACQLRFKEKIISKCLHSGLWTEPRAPLGFALTPSFSQPSAGNASRRAWSRGRASARRAWCRSRTAISGRSSEAPEETTPVPAFSALARLVRLEFGVRTSLSGSTVCSGFKGTIAPLHLPQHKRAYRIVA